MPFREFLMTEWAELVYLKPELCCHLFNLFFVTPASIYLLLASFFQTLELSMHDELG